MKILDLENIRAWKIFHRSYETNCVPISGSHFGKNPLYKTGK